MRAIALLACLVAAHASASDFVIQNSNRPFKGFNDRTPVEPAGLNFATTRGGQAQLVFRAAGAIWGATLRSSAPIYVDAAFATQNEDSAFGCKDKNRVVLGFARRTGALKDPSFPHPESQYPYALANALAGKSLVGTRPVIYTRFNADLGTKLYVDLLRVGQAAPGVEHRLALAGLETHVRAQHQLCRCRHDMLALLIFVDRVREMVLFFEQDVAEAELGGACSST